jgi:DNA-binding beta-propeller fold protein YncE
MIARSLILAGAFLGVASFVMTGESRSTDSSRLISSRPMPGSAFGESCTWEVAAYQAPAAGAAVDRAGTSEPVPCRGEGCAEAAARRPVRMVQDPYAGFSAIALDRANDEIVLADGFHFDLYAYDRRVTTSANAATTPKRKIGGLKTLSQFVSSVYVDQKNGDIYAVNNDSLEGMNVYSRSASGDVPPNRAFHAPYGSFGLAIDEEKQAMFVTIQHDSAIVIWPKGATGDADPIGLIQGDRTHMADPHGIAFDATNRLLYVASYGTSRQAAQGTVGEKGGPRRANWPAGNHGFYRREIVLGSTKFGPPSITVFSADARGNVTPLRVIEGPRTQLSWPTGIAIDPEHGEIFVANEAGDSVAVFSATANGDVAPIRVIKGAKSLIRNPTGVLVDTVNNEVWVSNYGSHAATVYPRTASGDVAPLRVIRSGPLNAPSTLISNPFSIAYDSKRDEVLVPNCVAHPRIAAYSSTANGNVEPARIIEGQRTYLNRTVHAVAYDEIHDEIVVNHNWGAILTFRGGANGDEAPIRVIQGAKTGLRDPVGVTVDPVHDEIFAFNRTAFNKVLVFDRRAQGDVAPKRVLTESSSIGVVDPVHNLLLLAGPDGIRVYDRLAEGDAKPLRVIGGPKTGLRGIEKIAVYPPGRKIIATTPGGGGDGLETRAFAGVWNIDDEGDVPPLWTVARGMLGQVRGLTVSPKHKAIVVSDKYFNAVMTFSLPEMFEPPARTTTARR